MPVTVQVHPDLKADIEAALSGYPFVLDQIIRDFTVCMASQGQKLASYMGCDQPYHEPPAARSGRLRHIHIALPPQTFRKGVPQSHRRCDRNRPELDAALVYVQGEVEEDHYMILAFLAPRAHEKQRCNAVMTRLGWIAKEFRDAH